MNNHGTYTENTFILLYITVFADRKTKFKIIYAKFKRITSVQRNT